MLSNAQTAVSQQLQAYYIIKLNHLTTIVFVLLYFWSIAVKLVYVDELSL